MKLYKVENGIAVEAESGLYLLEGEDWDRFVNDDHLFTKLEKVTSSKRPLTKSTLISDFDIQAPIQSQELWACGVTYFRSKVGRQEESKEAGGGDFYARVYEAERPEIYHKATLLRIVGPGENIRIRKDSTWDVPEPELTLMITSSGRIIGYTVDNDVCSRSIEGENPLYLPQSKTYDGCAALGPCIYVTDNPLPSDTLIELKIFRNKQLVIDDNVAVDQIKRKLEDLVSYLYRELTFPNGSMLMTGTGIVPPNDFTLQSGDEVHITIKPIGTLINTVA